MFQLDENTVSPTRIIGADEDGLAPIEETLSSYPLREYFVDKDGNICEVLLCNSRTTARNPEAERYADLTRNEWLKNGGLPLGECPHMPNGAYKKLLGRMELAKAPEGEKYCDGKEDAHDMNTCCPHLKKIILSRRDKARAKYDKVQAQHEQMSVAQMQKMANELGRGMANAMGGAAGGRNRLRSEQGEKD